MKSGLVPFGLLLAVSLPVFGQSLISMQDAFDSGKSFGTGGKTSAKGMVNSNSGSANLPYYGTSAPEGAYYQGGKQLLGGAGSNKQADCQTSQALTAFQQQECDAVNFMSKNPTTRPKFIIDKNTDPVLNASKSTINSPSGSTGSSSQQCHVITTNKAATFQTVHCERSVVTDNISCNRTLLVSCGYVGTTIKSSSVSNSGALGMPQITQTGTPGLYSYSISGGGCGTYGNAELDFNLDTVGQGGYLTINMSGLDDAAAVGVNGQAVFAGYPNNGPVYSGATFIGYSPAFQLGYSWSEPVTTCLTWDYPGDGAPAVCSNWGSVTQSFTATKLLDTCLAGTTPQKWENVASTWNLPGLFCNVEGKYVMTGHEGVGAWNGSVSATLPLQAGTNRIQVFWGTGTTGGACGGVNVTGQIYNVAKGCSTSWDDGCAAMRNVAN